MSFNVIVNGVNRTNQIDKNSIHIQDVLLSQVDTASFTIKNKLWVPVKGDEIIIEFDSVREFAGRIVDVRKNDLIFKTISVECQDYSVDLDRKKIAKVYEGMTAGEIIADILETISEEIGITFTMDNVVDTEVMGKVVFNYLEGSKCIQELADAWDYQFYVDYFKDIHFFPKGEEVAPFNITDSSEEVIRDSLEVADSFSELRNIVILRGGEFTSSSRADTKVADGEQTTILLAYKFAQLPVVTLNGTPIAIGVEGLNNAGLEDDTYVALWDYNQKYLRFKVAPAEGDIIVATGLPLFPLVVSAPDFASIAQYGRKEHLISDQQITSIDVAIQRVRADLDAYGHGVQVGSFRTYTGGLRSGQTINVNSMKLGVNETFLIRSVDMIRHGAGAEYTIELASNRVTGIIEFLQKLLLQQRKQITIRQDEIPNIIRDDTATVHVGETILVISNETDMQTVHITENIVVPPWAAPIFVLAPYFPTNEDDPKTPGLLDQSMYVYEDDPVIDFMMEYENEIEGV